MVTFEGYSAELHYNTLQDLSAAYDEFTVQQVQKAIDSKIGNLFVKHGVQSALGLTLLHRHFPISQSEKMVNYGAVACPWDTSTMSAEVARNIHSSFWRFTQPTVMAPYEFEYIMGASYENKLEEERFQVFLGEFGAFLEDHNLIRLLGVQMLDAIGEEPGLEFTADRANITLPLKVSGLDADDAIEALWVFDQSLKGGSIETTAYKTCRKKCVKKKTGHRKVHT
ncbi:uncharacterized protein LY89DRAFT_788446 [Mollisia scopiformis]|uniref:Uncharacterized protein n=1 Tax=Mollisia scopiformis TaxID=149040 RepID=A0A132B9F1_MOLSC|nr:uncharacterized protein LY89DRAFT_788446 [Mollisia scopiformis]KUJ09032.1 hypothetical protein LY89DRAFT_788446 [Mollisia scopiformis]